MPKTTVQKVIFGLLMSFFMVLAMEMYNTGLRNGGLTNAGILNALRELPLMFALCFLTSTVVGEPLAARLAARLAVPREWPFTAVLARSAMTVCVMCPAMSLWATVIFQQPGIELVPSWLQTVVCNFPMAFFWQIFSAVRWCGGCSGCWCPPRRLYPPVRKRRRNEGHVQAVPDAGTSGTRLPLSLPGAFLNR